MKNKPKFGIVSGAGPMAGLVLYKNAIQILQKQGCYQDADFPEIILYNYPFSDMLDGNGNNPIIARQLEQVLLLLSNQVDIIYIACQTLHLFLPKERLSQLNVVSLLDLIDVASKPYEKIHVIASKTSYKNNLHGKNLKISCEYIEVEKSEQAIIDILKGKTPDLAWIEHASIFQPVLLGCTEYSVALDYCNWNVIDPIKLAANDLVRQFL